MFNKKVTLSKTFTSQEEYDHFASLYEKQGTVAWENIWNIEVTAQAPAAGEEVKTETSAEAGHEAPAADVQKAA